MKRKGLLFLFSIIVILNAISACADYQTVAPVSDVSVRWKDGYLVHRVRAGETLYAIAWRYDKDYHRLADINHLESPYALHPGQIVYLNRSPNYRKPASPKKIVRSHHYRLPVPKKWIFPAEGRVVRSFSRGYKGIDIAGRYGEKIRTTASGVVVYSGNGIRGYGNLLIIKHSDNYLSAYAYNKSLFVKTGQYVKVGQTIASMGKTPSGHTILHFEIRLRGKPVNPRRFIHH